MNLRSICCLYIWASFTSLFKPIGSLSIPTHFFFFFQVYSLLTTQVEKNQKALFFMVRRQILEGQCVYYYKHKETIPQPLTENNVENFIYVCSTEQNKQTKNQNSM